MTELGNKLLAYWRVRVSGGRRAQGLPLPARVAAVLRAAPAAPSRAVFELEGVVFDQVRALWAAGSAPQGLLSGAAAAGFPEESLVLLHSGLGLALADRLLGPLGAIAWGSPAAALQDVHAVHAVDTALGTFLELCRANARPAYLPVARESLGLFVRMFRPRLVGPVDAALRRVDPDLAAGFWHGAGRALYFRPAHLLPGGLARAVHGSRREPPAANRLDALAGLAFAVAMINLAHPRAVERLLALVEEGGGEGEATEGDAITSGAVGCLLARHHTTPGDPALRAFLAHRPADPYRREAWERRVSAPGAAALARLYGPLRERGRLGDFARFQRLPAVEASLQEESRCAL
jgi:hypothetical protein